MSARHRRWFFFPAAGAFLALFLWGLSGLSPLGHGRRPYGDLLNSVAVAERHITDVVTAVTFDYRGFDTLAEEYILFASVMGVLLLLRKQPDEAIRAPEDKAPERDVPPTSEAVRVLSLGLVGLSVLMGVNVVTHGQLTPGGGFQGGVILGTAPLIVYLAGDFETFSRITSRDWMELAEAVGAGGYVLIGFVGVAFGADFLENVLPLGQVGSVTSGGTLPLISIAVGLAVSAGITLLSLSFLEETLMLGRAGES